MNIEAGIIIDANTRIKTLLKADQENVIEALVKLNSNFAKLKNPILRNLFASRVSIADACKIAKCNVNEFLASMQQIGFKLSTNTVFPIRESKKEIDFSIAKQTIELDVRPYLSNDQDPLKVILQQANALGENERLKITNTFEPLALIALLSEKRYLHHTENVSPTLVVTWFENDKTFNKDIIMISNEEATDATTFDHILSSYEQQKIKYVDVRGLPMPQPMLTIIDCLKTLLADELLYVYHKKLPVFLIPELVERGFLHSYSRKSENELHLLIYKK